MKEHLFPPYPRERCRGIIRCAWKGRKAKRVEELRARRVHYAFAKRSVGLAMIVGVLSAVGAAHRGLFNGCV